MFAVMQLMLWIAPFYIAWKILEFAAEFVGEQLKRRRARRAERPPRKSSSPAVLILSVLLAVPIGYVLALLIAATL